jgi:hypothetical protein
MGLIMTNRGHVKNGQIMLDEPARLPEGAPVRVEVEERSARIASPRPRAKLRPFQPIRLPGDSLADALVRDRR